MGDGAGGLHNRRFNRHRNGYRMRCKPPECRQSQPGFRAFLQSFQPSTGGRTVPETSPGECSRVFLGRSRTDCRLLPKLTDSSEGMPWALIVLSWLPHQMPRHGERCSPVCRQSRTASSGGLCCHRHPPTPVPSHPPGADGMRQNRVRNGAGLSCRLGRPQLTRVATGTGADAGYCGPCCERRTARCDRT